MANTVIRLKKSAVPGELPSSLEHGELAINYADGKLYYKDNSNNIQQISSGNSFATINASGTVIIADLQNDVLSFTAGENIQITGDYINDTITISANLKTVYDQANAAFDKANIGGGGASINVGAVPPATANSGSLWWSTETGRLYIYYVDVDSSQWVETSPTGSGDVTELGPVYLYANGIYDIANAAFDRANSSNDVLFVISSYDTANQAYSVANAAFGNANTANTKAGAAYDVANAAFASANNVAPQVAPSFNTANAAFDKANTVALDLANTAIAANNYAGAMANSANAYAASLTPDLSPSFNIANAAFDKANSANVLAFNTGIGANAYANIVGQSSNSYSDQVGSAANNYAGTMANSVNTFTSATYSTLTQWGFSFAVTNAAYTVANAAFGYANNLGYYSGNNGDKGNATGLGDIFRVHSNTLTQNVTIYSGNNALAAGPITVASGTTLSIQTGARLAIV